MSEGKTQQHLEQAADLLRRHKRFEMRDIRSPNETGQWMLDYQAWQEADQTLRAQWEAPTFPLGGATLRCDKCQHLMPGVTPGPCRRCASGTMHPANKVAAEPAAVEPGHWGHVGADVARCNWVSGFGNRCVGENAHAGPHHTQPASQPPAHHELNENTWCVRCDHFDPSGPCPGKAADPAPPKPGGDVPGTTAYVRELLRQVSRPRDETETRNAVQRLTMATLELCNMIDRLEREGGDRG